jgi:hypothetical protein
MTTITIKPDEATHKCEARVDGEWVVYTCPLCPGYECRIHATTGQLTRRGGYAAIRHSGIYAPARKDMH